MDLRAVYEEALEQCAPERLVLQAIRPGMPRNVVAIGKCAGALLHGVARAMQVDSAFVAVPRGYRLPDDRTRTAVGSLQIAVGGHPDFTAESFAAGEALLRFVDSCDDILFVVSGGGSACVEVPLPPFTRDELAAVNARLVASGLAIAEINSVRKQLSAIKGGKLAQRVRGRHVTLVYSDVSPGALADVASGPTLPCDESPAAAVAILEKVGGCNDIVTRLREIAARPAVTQNVEGDVSLIADNDTLTAAAASIASRAGARVTRLETQLDEDVEEAAARLLRRFAQLHRGDVLVAGGEPTVVKAGDGRGGRCSELAVRFARLAAEERIPGAALFGSSDGVDGNSGVAGILLDPLPAAIDRDGAAAALAGSDSFSFASKVGTPLMIRSAGNNLRDLYLLARG